MKFLIRKNTWYIAVPSKFYSELSSPRTLPCPERKIPVTGKINGGKFTRNLNLYQPDDERNFMSVKINWTRFPLSVLFLLFLTGMAVKAPAQYPEYEPINPYFRSIDHYESKVVFDFSKEVPLDQWTEASKVRLSQKDGCLVVDAIGYDPYFYTPKFPAGTVRDAYLIKIRMKSYQPKMNSAKVYISTYETPGWSESSSFSIATNPDGEFHDYFWMVKTPGSPERIRFDLSDDVDQTYIQKIELVQVHYQKMEISRFVNDGKSVSLELLNHGDTDAQWNVVSTTDETEEQTVKIPAGEKQEIQIDYPCKKRFEEMTVRIVDTTSNQEITRRFFAYHPDVDSDNSLTLKNDDVAVRFARDGSGAEILLVDTPVAVLSPLFYEDTGGNQLVNQEERQIQDGKNFVPVLQKSTEEAVAFDLTRPETGDVCGSLQFRLKGNEILFDASASVNIHAPVLRMFGTMQQGVFPGVEYLEKGEYSSSSADIETSETIRFAPPILWVTVPFMSIVTDQASFTVAWDDPTTQAVFATPNFLDGATDHRMNLCGQKLSGSIQVTSPEPLESAILRGVERWGLPALPKRPRTAEEQDALNLAGFTQSDLKVADKGWCHAVIPGPNSHFKPSFGSDFLSTIWELTGKIPDVPRIDSRGGHIANYSCYLVMNKADQLISALNGSAAQARKNQRADGSFPYNGKYLKGHWSDTASGHCGNSLFLLMEHWRLTGNAESLAAAEKGLQYVNQLKTPRGAQVWELSLHTPDIMGSSRCALANILAYEATGKEEYLKQARRWAVTGLPFIYFWEMPLAGNEHPIMLYSTIPVFGATNWSSPNWMGLPVQWCGLDYAYALIRLAPHDSSFDWLKIAEGIIIAGEYHQYPDDNFIGLLPDSFNLSAQSRNAPNINPSALHLLRRMLEGRFTSVAVVTDPAGKYRVMVPYPATLDGDTLTVNAPQGSDYQIIINGSVVKSVVKSTGQDKIPLK